MLVYGASPTRVTSLPYLSLYFLQNQESFWVGCWKSDTLGLEGVLKGVKISMESLIFVVVAFLPQSEKILTGGWSDIIVSWEWAALLYRLTPWPLLEAEGKGAAESFQTTS